MSEPRITTYFRINVVWREEDGGVNVYLSDHTPTRHGNWLEFSAEGWLWSSELGGANEREYFEPGPQRMMLPIQEVRCVYCPIPVPSERKD